MRFAAAARTLARAEKRSIIFQTGRVHLRTENSARHHVGFLACPDASSPWKWGCGMERDMALVRLWKSLIDVEDYFQTGIKTELDEPHLFGGKIAAPIADAYLCFHAAKPFLTREISAIAESAICTAAKEFNDVLHLSRRTMVLTDRDEAKQIVSNRLDSSLELFRSSTFLLKQVIPDLIKDKTNRDITSAAGIYR